MTPDTTFYPPSRGLWVWLRGAVRRVRCGRRFGHFPVGGWDGNARCGRCGTPLP